MKNPDSHRSPSLQDLATQILRNNGYTWSGRAKTEVRAMDPEQFSFERRIVHTPTGGDPRRRIKVHH